MNEVKKIKDWLKDSAIPLHHAVESALWDRRDNLLFRQGFMAGVAATALIAGLVILALAKYTGRI